MRPARHACRDRTGHALPARALPAHARQAGDHGTGRPRVDHERRDERDAHADPARHGEHGRRADLARRGVRDDHGVRDDRGHVGREPHADPGDRGARPSAGRAARGGPGRGRQTAADPARKVLVESAARHAQAALGHVASGDYAGEHWLATFAVYMLLTQQPR